MKKILIYLSLIICSTSCARYTVVQMTHDQINSNACLNPQYVGTGGVISDDEKHMTLVYFLMEAKKKYGEDVTIQNVRWDFNGKKKVSAIYDVIKCK